MTNRADHLAKADEFIASAEKWSDTKVQGPEHARFVAQSTQANATLAIAHLLRAALDTGKSEA